MSQSTGNISAYTDAPLKMSASIEFEGKTPSDVFNVLGDPELIPEWYLLAKEVKIHPDSADGSSRFNVEFTFFGDVFEEILQWNPPHEYIYKATGDNFPIKDYVARISVTETGPGRGVMMWQIFYSQIEGEHFRRILPVMLPAINKASMEKLAGLIGGVDCRVETFE